MKYGGGAPESPLSMGPKCPHYATVVTVVLTVLHILGQCTSSVILMKYIAGQCTKLSTQVNFVLVLANELSI